jgi:hypothetical protein
MIAAKVRLLNRQSTRETANVIGISSQYIGFASIIIAHAPELADLVINGSRGAVLDGEDPVAFILSSNVNRRASKQRAEGNGGS